LDDAIPEIHRHLADARPTRNAPGKVGYDSSVVDMHIDSAEPVDDLVDHPFHTIFIANVDTDCQGFSQLAEFSGGFLGIVFVEIRDDNLSLLLSKCSRGMLTDALCAARDNDYFILKHNRTSF
jgi:hypothetical protein